MPEVELPPPQWIANPGALRRMVQDLSRCDRVAVDTESNGLHAYQEQVCLIQFSTGSVDYLVDPLALEDLSALGPIFSEPSRQIIFHAAEYDILCLKRDFGFRFIKLFDTMVAARILGKKELGLAGMLLREFDVKLDKRYQRSNWARRPLPDVMQSYARLDSHYLIALCDKLTAELAEHDLLALAEEDFHRLANLPAAPLDNGKPNCWKLASPRDLNPQQAALLQALCQFRDQQARYANLPVFRILSDDVLLELAQTAPASLEELADVKGMTASTFDRYGLGLLETIEQGRNARPVFPPRNPPRPSAAYLRRHERLRRWRKEAGQAMQVESDVILPRDLMEVLCASEVHTPEELCEVMSDFPWRYERFGDQILNVLDQKGKRA